MTQTVQIEEVAEITATVLRPGLDAVAMADLSDRVAELARRFPLYAGVGAVLA